MNGFISIHLVNHVKMGRITLKNGKCVGLSLSEKKIKKIEANAKEIQNIQGRTMPGFWDSEIERITINGRSIGLSQCEDFYIFVE